MEVDLHLPLGVARTWCSFILVYVHLLLLWFFVILIVNKHYICWHTCLQQLSRNLCPFCATHKKLGGWVHVIPVTGVLWYSIKPMYALSAFFSMPLTVCKACPFDWVYVGLEVTSLNPQLLAKSLNSLLLYGILSETSSSGIRCLVNMDSSRICSSCLLW